MKLEQEQTTTCKFPENLGKQRRESDGSATPEVAAYAETPDCVGCSEEKVELVEVLWHLK